MSLAHCFNLNPIISHCLRLRIMKKLVQSVMFAGSIGQLAASSPGEEVWSALRCFMEILSWLKENE